MLEKDIEVGISTKSNLGVNVQDNYNLDQNIFGLSFISVFIK